MRRSAVSLFILCAGVCWLPCAGAQTLAAASNAIAAGASSTGAAADPLFQHSELSVMINGVFTRSSAGNPTTHLATNSFGFLAGYRVHLNRWEALEVEYGYTRNGQRYFTPATAPSTPASNYGITANMQELVANEVLSTPRLWGIQPFVLAGGGVLRFQPVNTAPAFARSQNRGAFNYGIGIDFTLFHLGVRAEYQGLVFEIPDFGNLALATNHWTHVAQPAAGLIFTF